MDQILPVIRLPDLEVHARTLPFDKGVLAKTAPVTVCQALPYSVSMICGRGRMAAVAVMGNIFLCDGR